jgi:hypothetical protein
LYFAGSFWSRRGYWLDKMFIDAGITPIFVSFLNYLRTAPAGYVT